MAIYHLKAQVIQRSQGKNAVASAAYRHATKMMDMKEGQSFDYSNKYDVIHNEILIPDNSPQWLCDLVSAEEGSVHIGSEQLWNHIEHIETRKDAQLSREFVFALPIELTQEQNIQLAREFIKDQLVLRGMVADWSVHWDEGNPHVHVMTSMRSIEAEGFGNKVREWNDKAVLREWRAQWSEYANFHLRLHGHEARIDHRSYKDQGVDLVPGIHLGKAVTDMEKRGIRTNLAQDANWICRENLRRIAANPEVLLKKMTLHQPSFSTEQLGQELGRYVNDQGSFSIVEKGVMGSMDPESFLQEVKSVPVLTPEVIAKIFNSIEQHDSAFSDKELAQAVSNHTQNGDEFAKAIIQLKASSSLIHLGPGDDGRERYTTKQMFALENAIQHKADSLREKSHIKISDNRIHTVLADYQSRTGKQLTEEQRQAVEHMLKPTSISCVVGRAGTGKSFSLGAAKEVWQSSGLKVHGVALSGIAADGLTKDAKIDSSTIESFRHALNSGKIVLDKHSVVVMDEAGMTDSHSMHAVLEAVQEAKAKLVLVGDHAQIQPVGPGASFRALLERLGFAELQHVYRQREAWQCQATVDFSAGRVKEALAAYNDKGCIRLSDSAENAMNHLVKDWLVERERSQKDLGEYLVVAYRNADVARINQSIRAERVVRGEITEGYRVKARDGLIQVAQGDRLLFLRNDNKLGVKNGRFATVQSVNFSETGEVIDVTVVLDGSQKVVTFNPKDYKDFALGYAATVHKVQGMTVDHAFVYVSGLWNRCLAYVAMTRHKISCHVYGSGSYDQLEKKLDRYGIKDSLLDYPLAFAERRGIDTTDLLKRLPEHIKAKVAQFTQDIADRIQQFIDPQAYHAKQAEKLEKAQQEATVEQIRQRRIDAQVVAAYVDAKSDTAQAWHKVQERLAQFGLSRLPKEPEALEVVTSTDVYQAFLKKQQHRNAFAAKLAKEPERYQKAIEIYDLGLATLQKQAKVHEALAQVKRYQQMNAQGMIVHRDRLAAQFMAEAKTYYPHIKAFHLDTKVLRQQAQAHVRRQHLRTLTTDERQAFYRVEAYRQQRQKISEHYKRYIQDEKIVARSHAIQLEALQVKRDQLAQAIVTDLSRHASALQFYGVGVSNSYDVPTEKTLKQQQQALIKWEQLHYQAKRQVYRDRVEHYTTSCQQGLLNERLRLAFDIKQDTKGHHAAIKQLIQEVRAFWLSVSKDAKRYEKQQYFNQLDLVERAAYKTVEAYVEAKRAHSRAWAELFDSKKAAGLEEKAFFAHVSGFADRYTQARNQLAANIAINPAAYQKAIEHFGVKLDELNTQAYTHQCHSRVQAFSEATSALEKGQLAKQLVMDTKGHYAAMRQAGVDWKMVYRYVRVADQKALFDQATVEEKRLLRLVDDYRQANQRVGQYYRKIKAHTVDGISAQQALAGLLAKRDVLAHRLVDHKDSLDMKQAWGEYQATEAVQVHLAKRPIHWEKLEKQAQQHTQKQQDVMALSNAYVESLDMLNRLTEAKHNESLIEGVMGWQIVHESYSIDELSKQVLSKPQAYQALLFQQGLTLKQLIHRQKVIQDIQHTVNQWRAAYRARYVTENEREQADDVIARITKAKQIEKGSKPIQGTLAERYLREHRGIQGKIPESYRFHPGVYHGELKQKCPALVVVAKNEHNQTKAVQVIFLDPDTANKAKVQSAKLTYGQLSGGKIGVLANMGDNTKTIAIAEGPETALSIAEVRPDLRVYATLSSGNFKRALIDKDTRTLLICADNDGQNRASQKKILEVAKQYALQGIEVREAKPDQVKQDFNDVLKTQGKTAVKDLLDDVAILATPVHQEYLTNQIVGQVKQVLCPDEKEVSLESLLKEYVEMSLEQTRLMSEKLAAMARKDGSQATIAAKMMEQDKAIAALAAKTMKHPHTATVLADKSRAKSLTELGGYAEIYERFVKGEFLTADIRTISEQVRNKVAQQVRLQSRDQSRGGRSQ